MCAYIAHRSGAFGVGICDYATLSYSQEFKKACKILNIPYACGYRVDGKSIFEGNGKIDINQSSCIGYFAAQSNRNTAAVNQTEGRRPGLKEKLADIKAKIEKFDKE